ncbi:hypothetical protein [Plantactinospora sp. CA-290183]|uniref:hypothetical protein n=1 Tax=Plantactinospora sp. CA-290183 TaxID=3240006 RepID=UPI003D8CF9D7
MLLRRAGTAALGGGLVTGLSVSGWPALVALLTLAVIAVAATCWTISDRERPKRLALLIRAWRGQPARPSTARVPTARRRSAAPARNGRCSPRR